MKEKIKEKKPVQNINISPKNDINCINFETKIKNWYSKYESKIFNQKKRIF